MWIAWRNNYQFHMTVVRLAGNEQVNNAMEQAMTTYRRAYAQLYTLKKDVIAANKASYHDFFVSSLERHDVFSAHEYLKKISCLWRMSCWGPASPPDGCRFRFYLFSSFSTESTTHRMRS